MTRQHRAELNELIERSLDFGIIPTEDVAKAGRELIAESSVLSSRVERLEKFVRSQPCQCRKVGPMQGQKCGRCKALGE